MLVSSPQMLSAPQTEAQAFKVSFLKKRFRTWGIVSHQKACGQAGIT